MEKSMSFLRKIFRKTTMEESSQANFKGQSSERLQQTNTKNNTADEKLVILQPSAIAMLPPPFHLLNDMVSFQDLNDEEKDEVQKSLHISQMTKHQFNNTCMDIVEWVSEAVTNIILPALADVLEANEEFHKIAKTVVTEVISRATTEVSPSASKLSNSYADNDLLHKQDDIHWHVDQAASDIVEIVLKELHNFSKTVQELDASDNKSISLSPSQASSTEPLLGSNTSSTKGLSAAFSMFKSVASKLREFFIQHPPLLFKSEDKIFLDKEETSAFIVPEYTFVTSVDQALNACPTEGENEMLTFQQTLNPAADSIESCSFMTDMKSEVSLDSELLADISLYDLTTCSDVSSLDRLENLSEQPRLTPQNDFISLKAAWCTPSPSSQHLIILSEQKCLKIAIELVTEAVLRTAEDIAVSPDIAMSHKSGTNGTALQSQNHDIPGDKKKSNKRMRYKKSFIRTELIFKKNKIKPAMEGKHSNKRESATGEQVCQDAHSSKNDSASHTPKAKHQKQSIFMKTLSAFSQARKKHTDIFQAKES